YGRLRHGGDRCGPLWNRTHLYRRYEKISGEGAACSENLYGACQTAVSGDISDRVSRMADFTGRTRMPWMTSQKGDDRMNVKAAINGKIYEYPAGTPF